MAHTVHTKYMYYKCPLWTSKPKSYMPSISWRRVKELISSWSLPTNHQTHPGKIGQLAGMTVYGAVKPTSRSSERNLGHFWKLNRFDEFRCFEQYLPQNNCRESYFKLKWHACGSIGLYKCFLAYKIRSEWVQSRTLISPSIVSRLIRKKVRPSRAGRGNVPTAI